MYVTHRESLPLAGIRVVPRILLRPYRDGAFLFHRKLHSYEIKMLCEDRTAAEMKMALERPAAGGESCVAGFFFIVNFGKGEGE